jgi:hypothetical protein
VTDTESPTGTVSILDSLQPGNPHVGPADSADTAAWIRAIATTLAGTGLITQLYQTRRGLDLTIVARPPGSVRP